MAENVFVVVVGILVVPSTATLGTNVVALIVCVVVCCFVTRVLRLVCSVEAMYDVSCWFV